MNQFKANSIKRREIIQILDFFKQTLGNTRVQPVKSLKLKTLFRIRS